MSRDLPPLPSEFFTDGGEFAALHRASDYLNFVVFAGSYSDREDETLRWLPLPLADLWILEWLDYEVVQGGLATYFINAHSRQAPQAIEALRRCGAEEVAQCLDEARAIVARHEASWEERNKDLDKQGEYAVVHPFQDLEGVDELRPVAERFAVLFDAEPHWRGRMNERLERFRREMAGARGEPGAAPPTAAAGPSGDD